MEIAFIINSWEWIKYALTVTSNNNNNRTDLEVHRQQRADQDACWFIHNGYYKRLLYVQRFSKLRHNHQRVICFNCNNFLLRLECLCCLVDTFVWNRSMKLKCVREKDMDFEEMNIFAWFETRTTWMWFIQMKRVCILWWFGLLNENLLFEVRFFNRIRRFRKWLEMFENFWEFLRIQS